MSVACPCCIPSITIVVLLCAWIVLRCSLFIINRLFPNVFLLKNTLKGVSWLVSVTIALIAVALGVLQSMPSFRSLIFAQICAKMVQGGDLDEIRCSHIGNISGRVLEIGPGPGTNFRCMSHAAIDEWVGVEPVTYFQTFQDAEKTKYNITFPTRTVWLNGENIDIDAGSFDAVVGTHVLCSVQDVRQVLHQVLRALKPGGTYYFLEHVAALPSDAVTLYSQHLLAPFFNIVGNGCEFRPLYDEFDRLKAMMPHLEVEYKHFEAPLPIYPVKPHIVGVVKKAN